MDVRCYGDGMTDQNPALADGLARLAAWYRKNAGPRPHLIDEAAAQNPPSVDAPWAAGPHVTEADTELRCRLGLLLVDPGETASMNPLIMWTRTVAGLSVTVTLSDGTNGLTHHVQVHGLPRAVAVTPDRASLLGERDRALPKISSLTDAVSAVTVVAPWLSPTPDDWAWAARHGGLAADIAGCRPDCPAEFAPFTALAEAR